MEVDFTAGSPVEAGEFDFTVTTSGNATPAVSNAIIRQWALLSHVCPRKLDGSRRQRQLHDHGRFVDDVDPERGLHRPGAHGQSHIG